MQYRLRLALLLGIMVFAVTSATAQVAYQEDFESTDTLATLGFTVFDVAGDGLPNAVPATWENSDGSLISPSNTTWYPVQFWDQDEAMDDWMITPAFTLNSGTTYDIVFTLECDEAIGAFGSDVQVYLATAATPGSPIVTDFTATTPLLDETDLLTDGSAGGAGQVFSFTFTPGATDDYHLAFRDWSAPADSSFYTVVDDIEVSAPLPADSDLTPDATAGNGRRGQENFYAFTVENTGTATDDFTIGVSGGTWTTALYEADGTTPIINNPVNLTAAATFDFVVGVTIPSTDTGVTENFTVSATGALSNDSSALDVTGVIYSEDFSLAADDDPLTLPQLGFTVEDLAGDGVGGSGDPTWFVAEATPFPSGNSMLVRWDDDSPNDDWAITPAIHLESGVTYNVSFNAFMPGFGGFFQDLEVTVGTAANSAAQSTQLLDLTDTEIDPFEARSVQFTPGATGDYFFGFHDFTDADVNITMIGNILIEEAPAFGVAVTTNDTDATAQRGTSVSYGFTVENTGAAATDYNAAVTGNAWTTTLYEADGTTPLAMPFNLAALATQDIVATVDIPGGATPASTDTFTLTVEDSGLNVSDTGSNTTTAAEYNWGGPNAGSYHFANSLAGTSGAAAYPGADWVDITGTGTDWLTGIGDPDEDVVGPIALGHAFNFFGVAVTEFYISTNGWISFTAPTGADFSNDNLPSANGEGNLIAGVWDDYDLADLVTAQGFYQTDGTQTVITWYNASRFGSASPSDDAVNFQIVLTPDDNFRVNIPSVGSTFEANATATVGYENAAEDAGFSYHFNGTLGPLQGSPLSVVFGPNSASLPVELSAFTLD